MKATHKGHRIFWLVRLLVGVGLATVAVTIGVMGGTLGLMRTKRALLLEQRQRLGVMTERILRQSGEALAEIRVILDESKPLPENADLSTRVAQDIDEKIRASGGVKLPDGFTELGQLAHRLVGMALQAREWRSRYDAVEQDIVRRNAPEQVRAALNDLRDAADTLESTRRLRQAVMYRRWRALHGDEAALAAQSILVDLAGEKNIGLIDFRTDLAELARLSEVLGREEQRDLLPDLKDNQFKPLLDRLDRTAAELAGDSSNGIRRG